MGYISETSLAGLFTYYNSLYAQVTNSELFDAHMAKLGDGFLPLSARIPGRLRVEVELLAVECLP